MNTEHKEELLLELDKKISNKLKRMWRNHIKETVHLLNTSTIIKYCKAPKGCNIERLVEAIKALDEDANSCMLMLLGKKGLKALVKDIYKLSTHRRITSETSSPYPLKSTTNETSTRVETEDSATVPPHTKTLYGVTLEEGIRYSVNITPNNAEAVSAYLSSKGFRWAEGQTIEEFPILSYRGNTQVIFDHDMCRGTYGICNRSTNIEVNSRFHSDTPTQEPVRHGDVFTIPGPTLCSTVNEVSLRSQADGVVEELSTIDEIINITDGTT